MPNDPAAFDRAAGFTRSLLVVAWLRLAPASAQLCTVVPHPVLAQRPALEETA